MVSSVSQYFCADILLQEPTTDNQLKCFAFFLNPLLLLRYRVRQSITSFFEQFFVNLSTQNRCNDARFYDYYNSEKVLQFRNELKVSSCKEREESK